MDLDDEKAQFKAFVGIDFGTDGSGLAYGLPDGSAYIHNMWDDTEATQKPKTSVLIGGDNEVVKVGSKAQTTYLARPRPGDKLFERFKMHLYEEPSSKSHLKSAQSKKETVDLKEQIASTNDKNLKEDSSKVFIAELSYLKEEAFNFINIHLKKKLNLNGNKQIGWPEIQYFLTVPAIWSDKAKDQMVEWAKKAGLISGKIENQLKIVYEPDCASLSIQHAILRNIKDNKNSHQSSESKMQFEKSEVPDITQWLTENNLSQLIPTFKKEKLKMKDILELGQEGQETLTEFLGLLEVSKALSLRIWIKIKKIIDIMAEKADKTKLNSLQPKINMDVSLKKGDKYILLDIGGGTCDVACHEIMDDFAIAEVLHPSGGKWGAKYIDDRFIQLLGDLFTEQFLNFFTMTVGRSSYLKFLAHFLNKAKLSFFEEQKKYHVIAMPSQFVEFICRRYDLKWNEGQDSLEPLKVLNKLNKVLTSLSLQDIINGNIQSKFGENDDLNNKESEDWMIKIIKATDININVKEDYVLSMNVKVWEMMFDIIIDRIINHCKQILAKQEMKGAKYIFLVGGFANSKYFQFRMKKEFSRKLNVRLPGLPGLCVVDGAARYGMDNKFVKIRRLAKSYGTKTDLMASRLDLNKLPKGYVKYYNNEKKCDYIQDGFNTFIKKNKPIRVGKDVITHTLCKKNKSQTAISISIIATEKDNVYLAKDCDKELGKVRVPLPNPSHNEAIVEFHFDTKLTVFAYPKGKPNEKDKCKVDYY